ncbi:MAG: outer membrane beta-barrel protein [Bacteroidales bacterium]|nr:outer membrane beta-barrel protein [Bacteroidales bacterium]
MKKTQKLLVRNIFAVVLQFILLSAFGQENFVPGRIIELNGDTLRGYIDYRNWDKNPKTIFFRNDIIDIHRTYKPLDIRGFMVEDELYESAIVDIETSPVLTAKIKPDPELHIVKDTTFLQTMIRGTKSLYYLKDRTGKSHFYIQDSSFILLIYKRYIKWVEGKKYVAENRSFLGQLINYLDDCPGIQYKIEKTGYNKISLEKLFDNCYAYKNKSVGNSTNPTEINFQKKTDRNKAEIGLIAGMTSSTITFKGEMHEYLTKADFTPSLNFTCGLYFDIIIPRQQQRWSVCNELTYTDHQTTGEFYDFESDEKHTMNFTTLGFSYINYNCMIRFKYPVKKMHFFGNAGISNGLLLNEVNIRMQEIKYYTEETTKYSFAIKDIKSIEQKINFGLGTRYKKLSFEFRYELGNGISRKSQLTSTTKRNYFMLGYLF